MASYPSDAAARTKMMTDAAQLSQEAGTKPFGLLPLRNVRVLDVSQIMAGPFCSMLLGDMGADVIKVEPPGSGDQTRRAMGFRLKGFDSLGFINLNRSKRSIVLNLKTQRFPVKLSGTPQLVRMPPPLLGAHREEILTELGFGSEAPEKLRAAGAVAP